MLKFLLMWDAWRFLLNFVSRASFVHQASAILKLSLSLSLFAYDRPLKAIIM